MISVADGCATLTDPGSGSELVTSCQPPLSNPLFVWGDDTAATSVNLIRVPPGTGLERTEGDSFNASYDVASGWLRIEYAQQPPLVFLTQNHELFRCELRARGSGVSASLTSRRIRPSLEHCDPPHVIGHPLPGKATCQPRTAEHFAEPNPAT